MKGAGRGAGEGGHGGGLPPSKKPLTGPYGIFAGLAASR